MLTTIVSISAETQKMAIVFLSSTQSWPGAGARLCEPGEDCAAGAPFSHDRIDWRACGSVETERSEGTGGVLIRPSFPLPWGGFCFAETRTLSRAAAFRLAGAPRSLPQDGGAINPYRLPRKRG